MTPNHHDVFKHLNEVDMTIDAAVAVKSETYKAMRSKTLAFKINKVDDTKCFKINEVNNTTCSKINKVDNEVNTNKVAKREITCRLKNEVSKTIVSI